LSGGNFAGQNLANAAFAGATLTDADFTGAQVQGASFDSATNWGFTATQLYSTASYQARDLTGIDLSRNDLSAWNFAGQNITNVSFFFNTLAGTNFREANLTNANFGRANLTGANLREANLANANFISCRETICYYATLADVDLTAADTRGAWSLENSDLSGATTTNLIWSDGHIIGLDLNTGRLLIVRDYDGNPIALPEPTGPIPITVDQYVSMGPGGTLRMVFEADAWDSTISFEPGIPVTLGGTLELTFAADVNPATQVGRTFDLFDWTGVAPTGAFTVSTPYRWNLSNLYTTGQITLTAVPEPSNLFLLTLALVATHAMRHTLALHRSVLQGAASAYPFDVFAPAAFR
jgi:uncharacterized protein YjbI with pentapeptide repeats